MSSLNIASNRRLVKSPLPALLALAGIVGGATSLPAQPESPAPPVTAYSKEVSNVFTGTVPAPLPSTQMDQPAEFHHYYGQQMNQWRDNQREIAKVFLKMDMNYDGSINVDDPADGGAFKRTPPGLMVATGEMARCIIYLAPYRVDYEGEAVVTLEIAGINRNNGTGEFPSFEQERASVGRVRVWRDLERKELLLDSHDPDHRYVEWLPKMHAYPYNLPTVVPRTVWVEGVGVSPKFLGDLRLLITVANRPVGAKRGDAQGPRHHGFQTFRTSFNHTVLTVVKRPVKKEFINNNVEGAWWYPDGSGVLRLEK